METLEALTHDIYRLVLDATEMNYKPGQYVDVKIPGSGRGALVFDGQPAPTAKLEFMIKAYPDGEVLQPAGRQDNIEEGHELTQSPDPTACSRCGATVDRPLLFIGGGAGMAPILALLRALADQSSERKAVYYYGARRPQGSFSPGGALKELEQRLPNFTFVPALSDCDEEEDWDGERGLITDVVQRL